MIDHSGKIVNEASPSMPVEILGMNDSAFAGAEFLVTESEDKAKEISDFRKENTSKGENVLKTKDKTTLFENQNPNLHQEATELQEDCCEYMDMLDNYLNLKQYTEIIEYNNNPYKYISIIPEN